MADPTPVSATPTPDLPLRLGTRASPLALAQAAMAREALIGAHGWDGDAVVLVPMTATGDRIQDRPLAEVGGKALWTRELDRALLDGTIDFAVHSMKDIETERDAAFQIAAILPRADVRDRLVVRRGLIEGGSDGDITLAMLPPGARIGTSSPRREAQLRALRPDLSFQLLRGNVATRLARVDGGECDATLLAAAGLDRLGLGTIGTAIATDVLLPAASQGGVGLECLSSRTYMAQTLAVCNHESTYTAIFAERAFLAALGGSCRSPIAALAAEDAAGAWVLRGEVLSPDGRERFASAVPFDATDPAPAAQMLAAELLGGLSPAARAVFGTAHG